MFLICQGLNLLVVLSALLLLNIVVSIISVIIISVIFVLVIIFVPIVNFFGMRLKSLPLGISLNTLYFYCLTILPFPHPFHLLLGFSVEETDCFLPLGVDD